MKQINEIKYIPHGTYNIMYNNTYLGIRVWRKCSTKTYVMCGVSKDRCVRSPQSLRKMHVTQTLTLLYVTLSKSKPTPSKEFS